MNASEPGHRGPAPSELHGLLDSFVGLTSLRVPAEILQRAVDIARLSTGSRYGAAVVLEGGSIAEFVFEGLTQSEVDALPHLPEGKGMLGAVLEAGAPIRLDRLRDDERSVGFPVAHVPMNAFLGVPISGTDGLMGALYLTKPPGHGYFTQQDEFFMVTLAGQTSVALETAKLIAELEEQRAITELLERVAVASNEATELSAALQTAVDAICGHTGWPVGHVYLPSVEDPDLLEPSDIWHLRDPARFTTFVEVTERTPLRRGTGLPGRVFETKKAVWVEDVATDQNFPRAKAAVDLGISAGFGLPIMVETEVVGVLEFFNPEARPLDPSMLEVGTFIGTQLGRVIERERARARMQALDQAKSEFVANAAHELRTPLTTILGLIELISDPGRRLDEQRFEESMGLLRRQGERITRLLTNLLDYSRIEAPSEIELRSIDLTGAVKAAVDASSPPPEVSITIEVPAGTHALADPVKLEQVVVNLLTNAYRYGGSRVSISARADKDQVVLVISDDGPGIDDSLMSRVFDPFTRGPSTQSITGSGLGLAIVKRLVDSFGGKIAARNQKSGGACFEVRLNVPPG